MLAHTLAVALVFFAIAFFFPDLVVSIFNSDAAVIAEGSAYLKTACFSYFGLALSNAFSTLLRATERVRLPMREILRDRPLLLCIAAASLVQASNGFLYSYSTLYWTDRGLSTALISTLWAVGVAS